MVRANSQSRKSSLDNATKSRNIRPRRSRNLSIAENAQERTTRISTSRARSRFVSSTLPFVLTIAMISWSAEKIPLATLAFNNNNYSNNNNPNGFRSNRIPTIRTNGRFCNEYQRRASPASKTTHSYATFVRGSRIARAPILGTLVARSQAGGHNDKDGEGDEYVDDLYEKFDEQKIFPYEFDDEDYDDDDDDYDDKEYLKRGLARLESMEKMLQDIEEYCSIEGMCEDDDFDDEDEDEDDAIIGDGDEDDDDGLMFMGDVDDLEDMESLFDFLEEAVGVDVDDEDDGVDDDADDGEDEEIVREKKDREEEKSKTPETVAAAVTRVQDNIFSPISLEEALLQGVVPVEAGVGSGTLPGDFGFDPFHFADKDYVKEFQYRFLNWLPGGNPNNDPPPDPRPTALVLRDYREAEIRHGRLAMLAVIIWPIQEKLDNFILGSDTAGPLLYGPVTLPYLPLFMTLIMMLLGYLDIYTKDIQEEEGVGDAFLPGDCFWDPLRVLEGAPPTMKRNMQERELFNGRVAMLAFAAFVFEELTSHQAIVDIPGNEVLFVPAYQIPIVQEWLDSQFLETYSGR